MRHPQKEKVVLRDGDDVYVQVEGTHSPAEWSYELKIDWLELAQQKQRLVSYLWDKKESDPDWQMWGIVHLIDAIQDQGVEDGLPVVFITADEEDE